MDGAARGRKGSSFELSVPRAEWLRDQVEPGDVDYVTKGNEDGESSLSGIAAASDVPANQL